MFIQNVVGHPMDTAVYSWISWISSFLWSNNKLMARMSDEPKIVPKHIHTHTVMHINNKLTNMLYRMCESLEYCFMHTSSEAELCVRTLSCLIISVRLLVFLSSFFFCYCCRCCSFLCCLRKYAFVSFIVACIKAYTHKALSEMTVFSVKFQSFLNVCVFYPWLLLPLLLQLKPTAFSHFVHASANLFLSFCLFGVCICNVCVCACVHRMWTCMCKFKLKDSMEYYYDDEDLSIDIMIIIFRGTQLAFTYLYMELWTRYSLPCRSLSLSHTFAWVCVFVLALHLMKLIWWYSNIPSTLAPSAFFLNFFSCVYVNGWWNTSLACTIACWFFA